MADRSFPLDVCVVGGCGHVGLPLAITFASRGLKVGIYDINERAVETVRAGRIPFLENGAEEALRGVIGRTLEVGTDPALATQAEHVVVVIGTPVDEHLNPTFHTIRRFFQGLIPHLRAGQTVILRSTVFPGTTEKVRDLIAAANPEVHVAFCPERVAEGRAMEELVVLPQIVSGCDEHVGRGGLEALRHDRTFADPADAARGGADEDLRQRLALHPVRHREPVLHDRRRPRGRLLHDLRRPDPRLPADVRPPPERVRRRPLPVQGHDAALGGLQQQLRARPRGDARQRGPAERPRPARPSSGSTWRR